MIIMNIMAPNEIAIIAIEDINPITSFPRAGDDQLTVFNPFDSLYTVGKFPDLPGGPLHDQYLKAHIMVHVNMCCEQYLMMVTMLQLKEFVVDLTLMMIIDVCQRSKYFPGPILNSGFN